MATLNLEKINLLIDKGQNCIPQQLEKAIIIIGITGSGKSTLINALVGKKLIVKTNPYDPNKAVIDLAEGVKGLKIGHNSVISETSVPEYIIDGVGYFDCPGFRDTKCDEQDIANSIFIKRIFDKVANVKIVVVAQQEEFTSTVGRGELMINFINQLINMFPEVDDLIRSICLIVTKIEHYVNNRTRKFSEPSLEQIIEKLNQFKSLHQSSGVSQIFQNQNFAKVFDTFLVKDRVEIFCSPTGEDGTAIDFPTRIQQMINSIPYIKSPMINSSIAPEVKLKLEQFYSKLYQDSKEQAKELKDSITQVLLKSSNLTAVLKMKVFVKQILNLKSQFEIVNPRDISDQTKTEYKTRRKELEQFVQLKAKNTVDILKLISFIADIQLSQMRMSDFLFIEIDNINNDIYKSINTEKNNLISNFSQVTSSIKQIINNYSTIIVDEKILKNFQDQLQISLTDNTAYLTNYSQILEQKINSSQIKQKLNELKQIQNQLQEIFLTMQKTNEQQFGSFPIDLLRNSLTLSFSDLSKQLQKLREITIEQEKQKAIQQREIQLKKELEEQQRQIAQQREEENRKAAQLKLEKEQQIAKLKEEQEIKEAQLKKEQEQKEKEAKLKAEKEKQENEKKLAELKLQQEAAALKQQQEEERRRNEQILYQQRMQALQAQIDAENCSRRRRRKKCLIF